jgi:hypothetical protein
VAGLSKALASLIQAFKDVFRVGKRPDRALGGGA